MFWLPYPVWCWSRVVRELGFPRADEGVAKERRAERDLCSEGETSPFCTDCVNQGRSPFLAVCRTVRRRSRIVRVQMALDNPPCHHARETPLGRRNLTQAIPGGRGHLYDHAAGGARVRVAAVPRQSVALSKQLFAQGEVAVGQIYDANPSAPLAQARGDQLCRTARRRQAFAGVAVRLVPGVSVLPVGPRKLRRMRCTVVIPKPRSISASRVSPSMTRTTPKG